MAVRSLQRTNPAVEMNMTEMRPTMVLGVNLGMSRATCRLRGRSHLRGLLDMTEAAGMKGWTTTCVIVRMRGGGADMVKTGEILAGHEETLVVQNGDGALFLTSLPQVRTSLVSGNAYLTQYILCLGDDRSWEPSASWKPGSRGSDQLQRQNNSKKNSRKNGKGKKKQQQQKREWRADDSQLNKCVAFTMLSPPIDPYIAMTFITAGPVETVGRPPDRIIDRAASVSSGGRLRGDDRDPQQTRIIRDDPLVAVPRPSTPHGADAVSTAL